jgi:hypothetical protein
MADDTLGALRRVVVVGVDLLDAMDVYAWGLDREFAALRAACSPGLHRKTGSDESARHPAGRNTIVVERGAASAARERMAQSRATRCGGAS